MNASAAAPDAASQIAGFAFAVLLLDPDNLVADANPAAEELLQRSVQRLIGMPLGEAMQFGDPHVQESMLHGDAPLVARDVAMAASNRDRRVDITSSPLLSHPGWRTVTLSDAGRGNEEQGDAMALRAPAILAHEIKNPLAAIRGASQLLSRRVAPRDRAMTSIIASEADRIAGLVDRMQLLGSAAPVKAQSCNLHEAIRSAMASVRAARGDAVMLVEAFDPSLPPVAADPAALTQVFVNLLGNGCDACAHADDPRVEVRTRFVSGQAYSIIRQGEAKRLPVEIVVSDNGPGIAADLRGHVFEPFVTSKPNGQGLGLPLVRKLIGDMGGRVSYDRDETSGLTRFRVNLALAKEIAG